LNDLIVIGRLTKPHKLNGDCRVFPLCDQLQAFLRHEVILVADEAAQEPLTPAVTLRITRIKGMADRPIVHLQGLEDRDAIEQYRGCYLAVRRADLPEPANDTFYHGDLIGMAVCDAEYKVLGVVRGLVPGSVQDILVVDAAGRECFIPFVSRWVMEVDVAGKRIVVNKDILAYEAD